MDNDEMGYTPEVDEAISDIDAAAFDEGWEDASDFDGGNDDTEDIDLGSGDESKADVGSENTDAGEGNNFTENETLDGNSQSEENEPAEGHQLYTLKSLSGEKQYGIDDVLRLATKGLDYDGVRQDRDRLREYESFLKDLADESKMSVDELVDSTRARIYAERKRNAGEEISDVQALLAVQREKAARKTATPDTKKSDTSKMINAFLSEFRNVEAKDIPESVWKEAHETGDLAGAYRKYASSQKDAEIARLTAENKALKQNKKNKDRSIGSLKSAGAATPKDPFDEGWDSV